jgi:hypothetical protein
VESTRQLKALALLEKVQRQELKAAAAEVRDVAHRRQTLKERRSALLQDAREEAEGSDIETRPYLPDYLRAVDKMQRSLERSDAELEGEQARREDALRSAFLAVKTTELLAERRRKDQADAASRVAREEWDTAGRDLYLRRAAENKQRAKRLKGA